ncbi:hypothetical protein KAU33_15020 [Candidatus Dependentiae bacterium]|nr:hypothetical protein [Candidatus Dependentiae bacterium]
MWNELKRTFRANKIPILISIIIFIFLGLISLFDKINFIKYLDNLFLQSFMFLAWLIFAFLTFIFAFKKPSFEDFDLLLPRTRLRQFLNKFIPGYFITNISSIVFVILIMKLFDEHIDFTFIAYLSIYLGIFYFAAFVIFFLLNSLRFISYILPAFIIIWEMTFPVIIKNPLFPELTYFHIYWNAGAIFLGFLVPILMYILFYRKNLKFHVIIVIITVISYILLSQGFKILKHYDHSGSISDFYAYDRYISVEKLDFFFNRKTIFYDLETKKTTKKIVLGLNVTCWDKDRFMFSMEKGTFIKIKGYAPMKLSRGYRNISINFLQDNYITDSFICKSEDKFYEVNLETYSIEEIKHSNYLTKKFWGVIRKEFNVGNFIISPKFGKIPIKSYYTNLVYDCSNYYTLQKMKGRRYILYDKNHDLVDVGENKLISLQWGRVGYLDNNRRFFLLHRGKIIDLDLNLDHYHARFIEEKFYYAINNEIIFGDLDTKKIHYQKFKTADIKRYEFMVYKYKNEYYLFLYARNPVKIYKFNNDQWEFYDKIY